MYISIYVIHAETSNGDDEIFGMTLSLKKALEEVNNLAKDTGYETWCQVETISEDYITEF